MGMEMLLLDGDALDNEGPFRSVQTTDLEPSGVVHQDFRREDILATRSGLSPHGGITYVDQAVGGAASARPDATVAALSGIRSARQRFGAFNGMFIGGGQPVELRTQGRVGLSNRGSVGQRAKSTLTTNLPTDGAVVAAFTNPALASLINKIRGN